MEGYNFSCGRPGSEIVVEEFLDGEEASFFALIDGETCIALASAQVYPDQLRIRICMPGLVSGAPGSSYPHSRDC